MKITIETDNDKSEYTYNVREQTLEVSLVWRMEHGLKVYMLPGQNECFLHNITPALYAEIAQSAIALRAAYDEGAK